MFKIFIFFWPVYSSIQHWHHAQGLGPTPLLCHNNHLGHLKSNYFGFIELFKLCNTLQYSETVAYWDDPFHMTGSGENLWLYCVGNSSIKLKYYLSIYFYRNNISTNKKYSQLLKHTNNKPLVWSHLVNWWVSHNSSLFYSKLEGGKCQRQKINR